MLNKEKPLASWLLIGQSFGSLLRSVAATPFDLQVLVASECRGGFLNAKLHWQCYRGKSAEQRCSKSQLLASFAPHNSVLRLLPATAAWCTPGGTSGTIKGGAMGAWPYTTMLHLITSAACKSYGSIHLQ